MRETDYLKENKKALELLKRVEKFKTFSDEELCSFLEVGKLREYEPGETIIKKGERDAWVYFLVSGTVKIVKGEKTFAELCGKGELFGEMGVIDGSPRSASVWAETKAMVLGIDCSKIDDRLKERASIFLYTVFRLFAESLAERLRVTSDEVLALQRELKKKDELIARLTGKDPDDQTLWV